LGFQTSSRRWTIFGLLLHVLNFLALSLFLALAGWRRIVSIARAECGLGHAAICFFPITAHVDIFVGIHACGSAGIRFATDSALRAFFWAAESHTSRATLIAPDTVKHVLAALPLLLVRITTAATVTTAPAATVTTAPAATVTTAPAATVTTAPAATVTAAPAATVSACAAPAGGAAPAVGAAPAQGL
jgi:hypothetical protein